MFRVSLATFACLACGICVPVAYGNLKTFTTGGKSQFSPGIDNQGWWSNSASSTDKSTNYLTGFSRETEYRSFFTFDFSEHKEPVLSATLRLERSRSSSTNEATETIELFDISTDAATLNANDGTNDAIFRDLGTGTSYGAFTLAGTGEEGDILEFDLNRNALEAINSTDRYFSVGAALTSNDDSNYVFGWSGTYTACLLYTSDAADE